jgi:hypothetical protein
MDDDFTLFDAHALMEYVGFSDRTEHEGYRNELERLDFSREDQARSAIRKWLVPAFEAGNGQTPIGRRRLKTAFRVALSRWGFIPHGPGLPGIDEDIPPYRPMQETFALERKFYSWVWDELFHDPFIPISDTDGLCERSDDSFANSPNNPQLWSEPTYRPLSQWDSVLGTDAWRENWPSPLASRASGLET